MTEQHHAITNPADVEYYEQFEADQIAASEAQAQELVARQVPTSDARWTLEEEEHIFGEAHHCPQCGGPLETVRHAIGDMISCPGCGFTEY